MRSQHPQAPASAEACASSRKNARRRVHEPAGVLICEMRQAGGLSTSTGLAGLLFQRMTSATRFRGADLMRNAHPGRLSIPTARQDHYGGGGPILARTNLASAGPAPEYRAPASLFREGSPPLRDWGRSGAFAPARWMRVGEAQGACRDDQDRTSGAGLNRRTGASTTARRSHQSAACENPFQGD